MKRRRKIIILIAIVLALLSGSYIYIKSYSVDLSREQVRQLEEKSYRLDWLKKNLKDDPYSLYSIRHFKVLGKKETKNETQYYVISKQVKFSMENGKFVPVEKYKDIEGLPSIVYVKKKKGKVKTYEYDYIYSDTGERNRDFPWLLLQYSKVFDKDFDIRGYYKTDKANMENILKNRKQSKKK